MSVIDYAVSDYLNENYPSVAVLFTKEAKIGQNKRPRTVESIEKIVSKYQADPKKAPIVDDSSDDEPVKKPVAKKAPIVDDSSDDEPVKKPSRKASPKIAAKKAPIDDSSDDEPVKKPSRKASPKIAAKKAPIDDSSDDEPVKKPAAKKAPIVDDSSDDEPVKKRSRKASPKIAAKKAPIDDSSDDEPVKKPSRKASPKIAAKKAPIDDSSDDDVAVKKVKHEANQTPQINYNTNVKGGPANRNEDGTYRRFQRIDPTKVVIKHEELKNNRPQEHHLALRQNREMMSVKGKNFNKLKQKNKGKFYGAPLDGTVRAFAIPDSDDDE